MIWTALHLAAAGATLALLPFFLLVGLTGGAALCGGRSRGRRPVPAPPAALPRLALLVPAHDEAPLIARTVASLLATDYPSAARAVVVIADNCSDATAAAARGAGAVCWERQDPRRGKGQALGWAIPRLLAGELGACDAVVIVDADTAVDPGLLRVFAAHLAAGDAWVQGYYLGSNADASWRTQLLTYALALFNGAWLLGQDTLGVSVALRGNGMCLSAAGLRRCPWAAVGLAEDMEFSWRLRLAGERVRFAGAARVFGELVSRGGAAAASQRLRWEHGRRALRRQYRGQLWRGRGAAPPMRLYWLFDLYLPPLAPLAAALLAVALLPAPTWVRALQVAALGGLAVYGAAPFAALALPLRYAFALRYLPAYAAWKVLLAARRAPSAWVRTGREKSQ